MAEISTTSSMKRDFSRVVLTLDNVLIPDDKLSETPSMLDGLDKEVETDLRILGCELIQTAGILLKLPQVAMATAQVVFQRFYYSKSFIKHNMEVVAMASIMLASKIEECPRRNRDVINVFHHIKQVRSKRTIHSLALDQHYLNLKNQIIKGERRVLKELGFAVHVKHPHKIIVMYLEVLGSTSNRKLVQCAWNFMNDSLRSDVFMRFHPESIACACIYLAARQCQVPLPNNPPWFWIFRVNEDEIQQICLSILRLYARPKPNFEQLEKVVEELKRKQQAAKSKARGLLSDIDTPNSTSRQNSPKVSPNPTSLLQAMRKEKEKLETKQASNGEAGSDRSDNDNVRSSNKKRNHDHSEDSDRSRDSKSNSSSHSSQRSRSPRSESPSSKKHKRSPSIKKMRKQESFSRDKHKRKYRSKSRSYSRSPLRNSKLSKKSRRGDYKDIREQYKEKDYYREKGDRDYYREKERERDYYKERDYKERDYKDRKSYSPEKDRHRSRKHRSNGHRDSPIREKLDKHRR
ncbi:cyclin-L1 [Biomphalaria glabrata]|nr:cyclin-L1 [Biomphalaria glabrata]